MTNNYHTPPVDGSPANMSIIRAPLSELDAELTLQDARISVVEAASPTASGNPTEYLNGEGNWTVPVGTGASVDGHVIKDEGIALPQRASVDFVGAGVTVTNEAGGTQVSIPGGATDHGALTGLDDDDHPQYHNDARGDARYLQKTGLTEWDEQGSDPSTPAANKWKLFFKTGGLYLIDDAGTVLGPITTDHGSLVGIDDDDHLQYLLASGLRDWDEQSSSPSSPASGKMKLYFKDDEKLYKKNSSGAETEVGAGGGSAKNLLLNGGFPLWRRSNSPSTPVAMTNDTYNAPDRWYSLVQGAGATIAQNAGIGTSQWAAKIVAGGTTNRYGIAQIVEAEDSIPLRGQSIIAKVRLKPVNNAGSGTRIYRIAILEWTGTADVVTSELVASWASSTYTTAGFFAATSKTLVGTASVTATHNTETTVSVTGTVSASCNNLIVFIWTENVPTHASDYVLIGEAELREGTSISAWRPRDISEEIIQCGYRCAIIEPSSTLPGVHAANNSIQFFYPIRMRGVPTITISGFSWTNASPGANQAAAYDYAAAAFLTITGVLSLSGAANANGVRIDFNAGTSFSGTVGNFVNVWLGSYTTAKILLEAEL